MLLAFVENKAVFYSITTSLGKQRVSAEHLGKSKWNNVEVKK